LSEAAVDAVLRWVGGCAPLSQLVFTYVDKRVIAAPGAFTGGGRLQRRLARAGERWTFGLDPTALRSYLAARGLELVTDLSAADYRARYLGERGLGYEFYHVAAARVAVASQLPPEPAEATRHRYAAYS
jgi:O-methyltransferase involved in polyketide biosynthesis